jgi:hypothetical protein
MVRPFKYPHNESDLQEALEGYYRAHGGFPQEVGVCEAKSTSYKEFEQHFAAEDHWKPIDCGNWVGSIEGTALTGWKRLIGDS